MPKNKTEQDRLTALYESAQAKIKAGRKHELTAQEAGALGGYPVRQHFERIREQAEEHDHSITEELLAA